MESGITIRQKEKTLQECKIKQGKCHMLRWQDISSFFYNRYRKEEILKRKEEKLMSLLEVKNVKKIYTTRFGSNQVEALRDVNFTVERGEYVAIMGESGSGDYVKIRLS